MPKVEVEARDVATNYVYKATTNDAGIYTIANLREGVPRWSLQWAGWRPSLNAVAAAADPFAVKPVDLPSMSGNFAPVADPVAAAPAPAPRCG